MPLFHLIPLLCLLLLATPAHAGFSFEKSAQEEKEAALQERPVLSASCTASLKDRKVAIMIGEKNPGGGYASDQATYTMLYQEINTRFNRLGLRTYTPAEIMEQIAQAEREAFLNNDPDAALSASSRLGADFILKGVISTRSQVNPILRVNEVFVTIGLTLVEPSGKTISDAIVDGSSYSGADTLSTVLHLVQDRADVVVPRLYQEYCQPNKQLSTPR